MTARLVRRMSVTDYYIDQIVDERKFATDATGMGQTRGDEIGEVV